MCSFTHSPSAQSKREREREREREMFYLTTHSSHFIYSYMASDICLRTILIVRKETRCRHIGYSFRLTARVLLYAPSHRQDNTYHSLCYTSRGALLRVKEHTDRGYIKSHIHLERLLQLISSCLIKKRSLRVNPNTKNQAILTCSGCFWCWSNRK